MITLGQALNRGLRAAMTRDPRVVVMGEDIGRLGGVFRVTSGLQQEFGADRVMDTPLAESGIVGTAIGLALRGYRPVCEIQFDGFVYPAFDQIVSQLAKMRARSAGRLALPVVIRIPGSGGIGAVEHHSESNEAYFVHTAGLRVVTCATPADGYTMIQQAVTGDDPVIFYEPKCRYWDKAEVDEDAPLAAAPALHAARTVRAGRDLTVLTYGSMVRPALVAAQIAHEEGRSVEVVDLRSLAPLDLPAVLSSVRRTRRAVVVHEAPTTLGLGAELSALLTEHCYLEMEAPVLRVGGYNIPYPPARAEERYLPDADRILEAVDASLAY